MSCYILMDQSILDRHYYWESFLAQRRIGDPSGYLMLIEHTIWFHHTTASPVIFKVIHTGRGIVDCMKECNWKETLCLNYIRGYVVSQRTNLNVYNLQKYNTSKHHTALLTIFSQNKTRALSLWQNFFSLITSFTGYLISIHTFTCIHNNTNIHRVGIVPTSWSNVWCYSIRTFTFRCLCMKLGLQNW